MPGNRWGRERGLQCGLSRLEIAPRAQSKSYLACSLSSESPFLIPAPPITGCFLLPWQQQQADGFEAPEGISSPKVGEAANGVFNPAQCTGPRPGHTRRIAGEGALSLCPCPDLRQPQSPGLRVREHKALLAQFQALGSVGGSWLLLGSASSVFSRWVFRDLRVCRGLAALLSPSSSSIRGHPLWQTLLMICVRGLRKRGSGQPHLTLGPRGVPKGGKTGLCMWASPAGGKGNMVRWLQESQIWWLRMCMLWLWWLG